MQSSAFLNSLDNTIKLQTVFTDFSLLHTADNGITEVWKALRNGRWHVLKCLTPSEAANPRYQRLLQKEFEISFQLSHANVVQTLGLEEVEGHGVCVVQEYVDGITWDRFFSSSDVTRKEMMRILDELCDAVDYIHRKQIIHRDIKPANILITHDGYHPKLIDFGFADRDVYAVLKEPAGTPAYASPEQSRPGVIDNRSDIYSLGVLIDGLPLRTRRMRRVARRCMANNPAERFVQAGDLKRELEPSHWWLWTIAFLLFICILALVIYFVIPVKEDERVHHFQKQMEEQKEHIEQLNVQIGSLTEQLDSVDKVNQHLSGRIDEDERFNSSVETAKHDIRKLVVAKFNRAYKEMLATESDSALALLKTMNGLYAIDTKPILDDLIKRYSLEENRGAIDVRKVLNDEWLQILYEIYNGR